MAAKLNFALIGVFLVISFFFVRAVTTSDDTYWHLSIGREVAQTKRIPTTDTFIYGPADKNLNSVEWLSSLFTFSLVSTFGQNGLLIQRVILAVAITFILYKTLKLITANQLLIYASLFTNLFVAGNRFKDRPEIFSYLILSFVNYCFIYYFIKRKLPTTIYLLPVAFLLWPNVHPYTIFGVAIVGFWCTLWLAEKYFFKKENRDLNKLVLVSAVSIIASVIQYKRFFVFLESGKLASHGLTEFAPLISELARSHGYDFFNQITYYIYFYLIIIVLYLALLIPFVKKNLREPLKFTPYLFYFMLLLLPFKAFRLISLLFPLSYPLFLMLLVPNLKENKYTDIAIKIFLIIAAYFVIASALQAKIIGNREYQQLIISQADKKPVAIINYVWDNSMPDKIIELIKSDLATKRIYTSVSWNNYFIWKLPQAKVFADALFYNMVDIDYENQKNIESGTNNWQDLIKEFDIDTFVVPTTYFTFDTPLQNLDNWQLVYIDRTAKLYARRDVIKNPKFDLSTIHPEMLTTDDLKFKEEDEQKATQELKKMLEFDPKNGFARSQLILYYFKKNDLEKAQKLIEDSRQILPKDPYFSLYLVTLAAKQNNCVQAQNYLQEANDKSYGDFFIKLRASDYFSPCRQKIQ